MEVNMNEIVGSHHLLFVTFDSLRYDVAQQLFDTGETPNLQRLFDNQTWERRHTPGSFTYAAHQAFFAGFLPTPAMPGNHPRLFATRFLGSATTTENTCVFETADIVNGLKQKNYHTICIGGVGFFSNRTPLAQVFPSLFDESHWAVNTGVTDPDSTQNQFELVEKVLTNVPRDKKCFLFINIAAIHQPNYFYIPNNDSKVDNIESHMAALKYVDSQLPLLIKAIKNLGTTFAIFCSDHGTTLGEDGYTGHRLAHPNVWDVPYKEFIIK